MKFTIVIPVYNVEKYLKECLDSAVNQNFSDFEIIAVNDGSTDNSLNILKQYEKKYENFTISFNYTGSIIFFIDVLLYISIGNMGFRL